MRKATLCANEGEHPARFHVWIKNGNPQSFSSAFTCFLPMIDSDTHWQKFENGDGPICMCEDAAGEWASSDSLAAVPRPSLRVGYSGADSLDPT